MQRVTKDSSAAEEKPVSQIEGIPSPGARWKRTERRHDCKWPASAIQGDVNRGTGILNNRRYVGVVTWGRSPETIERRVEEMKRRLAEGGEVARSALRELFPRAILLQPDDSGKHLWAEFGGAEEALRVSLLYATAAERHAAVAADFGAVEINGSGGAIWSHPMGVFCFSDKDLCAVGGPAIPAACGNGHPLSAENLCMDDSEARWRCRQCGRERAAAFRGRRKTAA